MCSGVMDKVEICVAEKKRTTRLWSTTSNLLLCDFLFMPTHYTIRQYSCRHRYKRGTYLLKW